MSEIIEDEEFARRLDLDEYRHFHLPGSLSFSADRSQKNAPVIENPNLGGGIIEDNEVSVIIDVEAADVRKKISLLALGFAQRKLLFEMKNTGRIERRLRIFYDLDAIFCFNLAFPSGLLIFSCPSKYEGKKKEANQ